MWILKAAVQGIISWLPGSRFWNYLFQRYVTRGLVLNDSLFADKVSTARRHLANVRQVRGRLPADFTVLELGTGRQPIVPIALFLCGAGKIYSVDIEPLLRPQLLSEVIDYFIGYEQRGLLSSALPDLIAERLDILKRLHSSPSELTSIDSLLADLAIDYQVGDIRETRIPPGSVDIVVSNSTFEHIPRDTLVGIMQVFGHLLKADGVMSHLIDISDHYSQFDPRITPYHYLRFSSSQWRWFNNALLYQNRLRVSDYRQIHREQGFSITLEENTAGAFDSSLPVADEFAQYDEESLAVLASWMSSEKTHTIRSQLKAGD